MKLAKESQMKTREAVRQSLKKDLVTERGRAVVEARTRMQEDRSIRHEADPSLFK